jgi:hypothetical protein
MIQDLNLWMVIGFLLASYSVIANDGVQTLGTWIASNGKKFKWYWLWSAASFVLLITIWYGWASSGGDISFGRLSKIPFQEVRWYHTAAPLVLLLLTRFGIPASTTFLVLSTFASGVLLEKMLMKSIIGYSLAATLAFAIWFVVARFINEKEKVLNKKHKKYWRLGQWFTTGFLWYTWLSHDLANVAVFLPREISFPLMLIISVTLVLILAIMFYENGGKIQKIVLEKTGTSYIRSATIIDFVYAVILVIFKEYNQVPMSTTWVFIGLLCGRELAISTIVKTRDYRYVFPMIAKDFIKMVTGLLISVGMVLAIHNFLN